MRLGTAHIIRANSRNLPLADDSVDLVVTSPPYFALRSYQDGGEHYAGQIGDEPTRAEFVDSLLEVTRECVRVLKPSGSLWVNLGDKYSTGNSGQRMDRGRDVGATGGAVHNIASRPLAGMAPKSLIGIPWRYALRCIDDLGLILRAEVIWSKPNGLPESVTDRVRRSHEQWFYFEQSGGVEAATQRFPFCPLCGRPVDARSTLVARTKEADCGVEPVALASEVRPDDRVDTEHASGRDGDEAACASGTPVPMVEGAHAEPVVDAVNLVENGSVSVVDADAENGSALAVDQRDGALSVDDSGKPSDVCECVGHPLIINDEPWIPQSLAAEIVQSVADGECDPQQAADFLSGDYVRNHSVWFHFTLNPRYFSAVDEIREGYAPGTASRYAAGYNPNARVLSGNFNNGTQRSLAAGEDDGPTATNPLGKLPGSVWTVPTEPLRVPDHLGVDHFAAFPTEFPKRIIAGWSPAGVCVECGEGRRPVAERDEIDPRYLQSNSKQARNADVRGASASSILRLGLQAGQAPGTRITGYSCACPEPTAPTTPAVVLDPFGGTGTTAMVAKALGRHGISVDMSADYCRLAEWRTNDRDQLAKVLGLAKADPVAADEQSLLDLIEGGAA